MTPVATARVRALAGQAGVGLLIEIGRGDGLFAAMSPNITAATLAARCNVAVELARDWLDGLVLARLVEHDGHRGTYSLLDDARAALSLVDGLAPPAAPGTIAAASLGAEPLDELRALQRALAPGETLNVVELRAADCVADNLDHPLGPALYAVSLERRRAGGAGVLGEGRLRALMLAAGFVDVESRPLDAMHIVVGGRRL